MRSLLATFVLVLASSSVGCADEAGDLPAPTAGGTAPGDGPGPDGGVADARALEGGARDDASRPSKPSGPPKTDGTFARKTGLSYAPGSSHAIDLWVPNGSGPFPVVLYVHGGAWLEGDRGEAAPIAPRLASRGYVVASIDYRLSGAARFPAQIQDAKAAVRWLRAHAGDYDLDEGRIAAWGSSAGAHLAALLGTSGGVAALEDLAQGNPTQSSRVQAVVDWYGPTDFRQMDAQTVPGCQNANHDGASSPESALVGCAIQSGACAAKVAAASPIGYVDSTDPPHLLMHGTQDCTVPTGQSRLLDAALRGAGASSTLVLVNGLGHDFDGMRADTSRMQRIDAFLDATLYP